MIWYRSLSIILLSSLVACQSDSPPVKKTTVDPITEQDRSVTEKLLAILDMYARGEAHGNNELISWLKVVKEASKWNKHKIVEKGQVYIMFNQYDKLRKDLDEQINDRLEILVDDLIPTEKPYNECWTLYIRQRNALRKALKQSNAKKTIAIQRNSVPCTKN
ncbi:uncharacterized protein [Drosophila tropicalis]|uniref:uncharacterized protein n=1 Tax=Drosophila tropicalis TaxID=46794 RepID=UPI0035ABBB5E